ncbi:restriction endonuclease subunit S [Methanomethylophilus alvi]|uniref:restriction endonuclease subunit S n=1 Tax=Methanomethylophilus alvi TaxID=1291540 RepID=UPI0037DCD40F
MDVSRITTGSSNTVDSKEIGEYPFFDRSQTIKRSDKYLFDSEAIIVPGEGSDFIPRYFKGKFDLHQRAYALFPRENIDGKYLYYAILNNKKHFSQVATGSTVKSLRLKSFELLKIPYVDADIQIRISTILSSIDDKIAINKQINANLSNQARVAFSSLMETADLSKAVLSEVADITMGQSPPGESLSEDCAGTLFYQGRAEFGEIFPTPRLYTSEPKRMASKRSVLMSVRAPVGDINLALDECCIGRGLSSIQSNEGLSGYVHYLMDYLKPQLDIFNGDGTVFGSINKESVNNLEILIPSKEDREKFDKLATAIDAIIELNHREILKLQEFRDYLLPKLMSGEIDVSDLPLPN